MLNGQVSVVAATKDYFGMHPDGRTFVSEFKELTQKDRTDLREMLTAEGYDVAPLKAA